MVISGDATREASLASQILSPFSRCTVRLLYTVSCDDHAYSTFALNQYHMSIMRTELWRLMTSVQEEANTTVVRGDDARARPDVLLRSLVR